MLKIYNSYYMYQLDHGEWNRFGYTGWFCKEESDVTDLKIILKDATFEQAFERFEKKPDHSIFSSRTFILHRPYLHLCKEWLAEPKSWSRFNGMTDTELNEKTDEELEEMMLERDDGYYSIPEECCPICQFIEYSNKDLAKYLEREYKVSRDEVFDKVKQLNKRRKKLYDSEYVTEVCSRFHLNPAEIVASLKDRFGTYRRFYDYIHKG